MEDLFKRHTKATPFLSCFLGLLISMAILFVAVTPSFAAPSNARKDIAINSGIDLNVYYYIRSRLDGFVLDIVFNGTNPGTEGIPVDAYPQKNPPSDNQLWQFVSDGNNDGYYFIVSRSCLFLDVHHDDRNPGTQGIPIIAFSQNARTTDNQLWRLMSVGSIIKYYFIVSKSGLFVDIAQSQTIEQAPVIAFSQDQYMAPNQYWTIDKSGEVVQDSPGTGCSH